MKRSNLFRDGWKDYFVLSNRLRKGLVVLFIILSAEVILLLYLNFIPANRKPQNTERFKADIEKFFAHSNHTASSMAGSSTNQNELESSLKEESLFKAELFPFNPNNLPSAEWKRLGFTDKQVHVIKNYESKGGKFRSKADVKKMYCINNDEYNRIESYIIIPNQTKSAPAQTTYIPKPPKPFLLIDINTADSTEFEKLYGIGPVKARIIVNYREKLGGFYSINQIREVWGIDDSLFASIKPHLTLSDSTHLRKINLNTTEYNELRHPYINKNLANVILNYHKQHGAFGSVDDLRKVPLVDEELYFKIAHYLKIE